MLARVSGAAPTPSGIVTLLFTDIEGSTRHWETEPQLMADALRRHDEILRTAIERADGYVFKTVGDAFCAAFTTPSGALDAVLTAQRQLAAEPWPTSAPIRVRMALHSGACEERDGDYYGPTVNRTARLEAIAHGGQVLVSGATASLAPESLPDGVSLADLGLHRLKDLGRPEQVFQLQADFLQPNFPPLASLDNPELPNNLPAVLSSFVGRERELEQVHVLTESSRLVTLTGTGGCGKTRLAMQGAADALDGYEDGVWLVELATVTDAELVPGAVAAVLGLREQPGRPVGALVCDALAPQRLLLMLDNCEHVIDAVAKLCDLLLRGCPKVHVLATSREPLGIDGERVYRVPSLSLPRNDADLTADVTDCDSVALFADRASTRDPGFTLDEQTTPLVATICRRLDGVPLALELAAARLASMSLRQVCDRLDQRFRLLTGGSRSALPRQQTLQATVDWSFSLLSPAERETLTRLSVFSGGFELEAAEAVCATDAVDAIDVLDLLGSLVDKSLVVAEHTDGSLRYGLLETIRQYAAHELLHTVGEDDALRVRDRHAEYYLRLAESAWPALTGAEQGAWMHRLDRDWDNIRVAVVHLEAEGRAEDVLRFGVWLDRYAVTRGSTALLAALRRAIDAADPTPRPLLVRALIAVPLLIGVFPRTKLSELAAAQRYAERALEMARELGDRELEARALGAVAGAMHFEHDPRTARLVESAMAIAGELGDTQLLGALSNVLASTAETEEEGRRIRRQTLEYSRQSGDILLTAAELGNMAGSYLRTGQVGQAREHEEEALALAEQLGGEYLLFLLRSNAAILRLIHGDFEEAAPLIRACVLTARRIGVQIDTSELIFCAACCTARLGDHDRAARLFGAGDAHISAAVETRNITWTDAEQRLRETEQGRLREMMGEPSYDAAYRAGRRLSPGQAVELALGRPA